MVPGSFERRKPCVSRMFGSVLRCDNEGYRHLMTNPKEGNTMAGRHRKGLQRGALVALATIAGAALGAASLGSAAGTVRPANIEPPQITGTPESGSTLTATEGRWSGNPTDINVQWRRCDENGASCSNISGAEGTKYILKKVDEGNTIRARATASNADGSASATSVPTAVIRAGAATPPPPPSGGTGCQGAGATVQIAGLAAPERLNVDRAEASPAVVGGSTDRVALRVRVTACNGKPVQGALVYVTATPYNQFSIPPEATTGADGFAELSMSRLRGYPASQRQRLLVLFIRARKQGENLLGGISSRRLVSIPVDLSR